MLTVILCVVSPVLHEFPELLLDVKTTLLPEQNVAGPFKLTVGVLGFGFTITEVDPVAEVHPFPSVTLTV